MRALISGIVFLFAAFNGARAQSGDAATKPGESEPPALAALRARCAENLLSADQTVIGLWAANLATMEKTRADHEDYAGAERVQRRRESALAVTGTDDGRVSVRLAAADLARKGSGLKEDEASGIITMSSSGAFIEWEVSGDFKGTYEVRLEHAVNGRKNLTEAVAPVSVTPGSDRHLKKSALTDSGGARSGWVLFQNVSGLKPAAAIILQREIVSTGGSYEWTTVSLGRMEISGRLAKFHLSLEEAGSEPLRFRSIELVPVHSAPATGDAAVELAKIREVFNREFRILTQPANSRYRDNLTKKEQEARRANDSDAIVRLRNEKAKLASTPEQLALGEVSSVGPVVLDLAASFKCFLSGAIGPDSTRTGLTKLRPAHTASITWKLAACNIRSGVYSVEIKGRVPVNGGGKATLAASGNTSGKPLEIVVKPVTISLAKPKKNDSTVDVPAAETRTLLPGSITIGKGAETLTLTVTGLTHPDSGWLMDISQITLTRTGEAPAATAKNP